MANRRFQQFFWTLHHNPVKLNATVVIGASGAVSSYSGAGVSSVTQLATGVYQVTLQDPYFAFLNCDTVFQEGTSGTAVASNAAVAGTVYQITALGTVTTADWQSAGFPVGATPVVGAVFVATGGTTGTSGSVQTLVASGCTGAEVLGLPSSTTNNGGPGALNYFVLKTLNGSTATNPASGTTLLLEIMTVNSSATAKA